MEGIQILSSRPITAHKTAKKLNSFLSYQSTTHTTSWSTMSSSENGENTMTNASIGNKIGKVNDDIIYQLTLVEQSLSKQPKQKE